MLALRLDGGALVAAWSGVSDACLFCRRGPEKGVRVFSRGQSGGRICDQCLKLCRDVLLAEGAQQEFGSGHGLNALAYHASQGTVEAVRAILDRGADPNVREHVPSKICRLYDR